MSSAESSSDDVFDLDRIRGLIDLMKEHDLSEIDLRQGEQRISLRRGEDPKVQRVIAVPAQAAAPSSAEPPAEDEKNIAYIKSPMVGTFYSKPNPNSEPFVKVGDRVNSESVVCIVEAMKMFNEIQAEVSGQIVAVLVDSEEPVEFGKPLFKVDTSK